MKRFLLILIPYFFTCGILSALLFIRPKKFKTIHVHDKDSTNTNINYRPEDDPNFRPPIDTAGFEPVEPPTDDNTTPPIQNTVIVIVGSFRKSTTANELCEKLKPAGFNSRVEKDGDIYRVVAGDYETEFAAQDDVNTLKEIGFEPWIKKD